MNYPNLTLSLEVGTRRHPRRMRCHRIPTRDPRQLGRHAVPTLPIPSLVNVPACQLASHQLRVSAASSIGCIPGQLANWSTDQLTLPLSVQPSLWASGPLVFLANRPTGQPVNSRVSSIQPSIQPSTQSSTQSSCYRTGRRPICTLAPRTARGAVPTFSYPLSSAAVLSAHICWVTLRRT